tara:strand:- start:172 stop:312 length:141 start_codon:yes stop_codon:yes gene_type:complete
VITAIILTTMLSVGDMTALPPDKPKIEARKRGKGQKGRRRGGNGLR